jgi:hypothetical protein
MATECNRQLNNTASSECPEQMSIIKSVILFDDKSVIEYTGTTDSALNTWVQNAIHAATKLSRAFPLPLAVDLADNNAEPEFTTTGIGIDIYSGIGAKGFTHTYMQDMQLLPKLAAANGLTVKALLVDDKKQVWGLTSTVGYAPFEMMATTYNGAHKTNEYAKMMTRFNYLNPDDYNNLRMLGTLTSSLSSLKGLADVTLENVGTATAPVIKLFIDGSDITSRYSTLLAVKEAWLVKGTTPASNPVYDSAQVGFKTWGTTAATDVIQLVDPALLHALAAPVNNIEGTPLTL